MWAVNLINMYQANKRSYGEPSSCDEQPESGCDCMTTSARPRRCGPCSEPVKQNILENGMLRGMLC